jgi:hypothetical protein
VPHFTYPPWASYDGQFYAQRALDPLCRDPQVDRAMDLPAFRARRILLSWTAYVLGLGRAAWIIQVYAVQNVVCWLLLARLLARWIPPVSGRGLALWTACLFSHGLLWSVRFALLDGPSLLLIACAVWAVEAGRPLLSAAIVGIAGLARETNVLAVTAQPLPRGPSMALGASRQGWLRMAAAAALAIVPLLIWEDYLRSIYRSTISVGMEPEMVLPGRILAERWVQTFADLRRDGILSGAWLPFGVVSSVIVQAIYLLVRRGYHAVWWRTAVPYIALLLVLDRTIVDPHTGAITRVLLPLTAGFNILLARESRPAAFWSWFAAGNLHLLWAVRVMPLLPW